MHGLQIEADPVGRVIAAVDDQSAAPWINGHGAQGTVGDVLGGEAPFLLDAQALMALSSWSLV